MTEVLETICGPMNLFALAQRQKQSAKLDWITMNIDPKMTVCELITNHPSAMEFFIERRMLCVGCPTDTFHTLEDVAKIHDITLKRLLQELRNMIYDHE